MSRMMLGNSGSSSDAQWALATLRGGHDVGLLSDAGCPGVADPGAVIVAAAHAARIHVVPLVGPSAVLLALMAAGMNGQRFTFHGYLPVKPEARAAMLRTLEQHSRIDGSTELFIETPYRNVAMLDALARTLQPSTRVLSVGAGHEPVLYWLANRVAGVIGTDMYSDRWEDEGAREGDVSVLVDPSRFAPFPYERDRLRLMRMDGRALAFADGTFDVVYSLSSIEHFGGLEGAGQTMKEMARVIKPGGILALATEYVIAGPPHEETFQPLAWSALALLVLPLLVAFAGVTAEP